MNSSVQPALVLHVQFPPVWSQIEPLQTYVQNATQTQAVTLAERTGIVVQELLENAVKYGDPSTNVEFKMLIAAGRRGIELSVTNKAHPRRIALLQQEYEAIGPRPSRDTFSRAVQRLQRLPQGISMLGLARIMMEATITLKIENDELVIVSASIQ